MADRNRLPHHVLLLAIAALALPSFCAFAQGKEDESPDQQVQETAAPRSIDDIIKVLDHYKPDVAAIEKARATLKLPPPESTDRAVLFRFYAGRGAAAFKLGDSTESIDCCSPIPGSEPPRAAK